MAAHSTSRPEIDAGFQALINSGDPDGQRVVVLPPEGLGAPHCEIVTRIDVIHSVRQDTMVLVVAAYIRKLCHSIGLMKICNKDNLNHFYISICKRLLNLFTKLPKLGQN